MENQFTKLTEDEEETVQHLLMLAGEIDSINDQIRLLYIGKDLAKCFRQNGIRMP